jgi:hypothetical protein
MPTQAALAQLKIMLDADIKALWQAAVANQTPATIQQTEEYECLLADVQILRNLASLSTLVTNLENTMQAQIAAIQTSLNTLTAGLTSLQTLCDNISGQLATALASPTLGADDVAALTSIKSTLDTESAAVASTLTKDAPPTATASGTATSTATS